MGDAHVPTREGYDRWSAHYDADENPLIALEQSVFADLRGEIAGLDLLDVGCGTGRHTVAAARLGARVTAIDFSQGMLDRATEAAGDLPITFIAHDLHTPFPLGDDAFDAVLCALVLDHIADLDHLFAEFRRVARPGGRVLITVMHPAMMLRGVQARFTDPALGTKVVVESVPNQVTDYVNAALGAGLAIDHLAEHAMTPEVAGDSERARVYVGWPMLLTMRLLA